MGRERVFHTFHDAAHLPQGIPPKASSRERPQRRTAAISPRFENLLELLAEGDLALYGEISQDVEDVPSVVQVGETYVACDGQVNWYEILEPPHDGCVFVRVFSIVFRRGDYDRVSISCLMARVSPRLFQRAKANGFRSIRAFS